MYRDVKRPQSKSQNGAGEYATAGEDLPLCIQSLKAEEMRTPLFLQADKRETTGTATMVFRGPAFLFALKDVTSQ